MIALLLAVALADPAAAARRPNLVVIDICSARADRLAAYGGRSGTTPGLDEFSRDAAVFTRAWAQGSWCLPNYATLLTGLRPEAHGLHVNRLDGEFPASPTLAERLAGAGYRTGGFSGGVYLLPAWGLTRGFDRFVNRFSSATHAPARFETLVPDIERWLDEDSDRPFFLYTTVDDLHAPYQSDESSGASIASVSTETAGVRFFRAYNGEHDHDLGGLARELKDDPEFLAGLARRYDASYRAVDREVSRFLERLRARGLYENTVVVVTSDHGEMLGEKGLLGHTEGLYEPVLRVPMIVRHPRLGRGARLDSLVERADLAPTLLEAGGAPAEASWPGRSLLPLLADPKTPWRRHAYASSQRNSAAAAGRSIDERAVTDGRWKLIWYSYRPGFELYDLRRDPGETRDLAGRRPEIVSRLAFELQGAAEAARRAAPAPAPAVLSPARGQARSY